MSQIECIKKCNRNDRENKSVKRWSSQSSNSVRISMHYPSTTMQLRSIFGLNRVFWHKAPAFESIGGAQQSFCWFYREMKCIFLLGNWRKWCQKPKASCNTIFASLSRREGNDDWFATCRMLVCFGYLTAEVCVDKYTRKVIKTL